MQHHRSRTEQETQMPLDQILAVSRWRLTLALLHLAVVIAVAVLLMGLTPAFSQCNCQESVLDKIQRTGVFTAGVRVDYPPLGFVDKSGNNVGFAPDLAREFAKRLGVSVKFVTTISQNRIPNVVNNVIDAEISSASITRRREEVVDFSIIYMWDQGTLLVRKGESINPQDYVKAKGKKLGTIQGGIYPTLFKNNVGEGEFTLFQEYTDALLALMNGRIDAEVLNETNAIAFKKQYADKVASGQPFVSIALGITLRQNDSKWRNWVNHTLQDLWADGTYQKLYERFYGEKPNFYMWSPDMLEPKD
jgi:polar amino acid transport system substrate-binding protein